MNILTIKAFGKTLICLAATALLLCGGCVKDDRDGCRGGATMCFEYTFNDLNTDLFTAQSDHLSVYIYDSKGNFVECVDVSRSDGTLGSDNKINLSLPYGTYTAIAWANHRGGDFDHVYDRSMYQSSVSLKCAGDGSVASHPNQLMHGIAQFTVSNTDNGSETTISMKKNSNDVKIVLNIIGSVSPVTANDFEVYISGCNGTYNHDNTLAACRPLTYIPARSLAGVTKIEASFRVLRILRSGDLQLLIKKQGTRAPIALPFSVNLADQIALNPTYVTDNDFDRTDRYTLTYDIDVSGNPAITLVSINDWTYIDQGIIVGP